MLRRVGAGARNEFRFCSWRRSKTRVDEMEKKTIKRRTKITVETERLLIVNRHSNRFHWCEACAAPVEHVTPQIAATLIGSTCRRIYRWIETNHFHFIESLDGCVLICLNSLLTSKPANSGFTAVKKETT